MGVLVCNERRNHVHHVKRLLTNCLHSKAAELCLALTAPVTLSIMMNCLHVYKHLLTNRVH